MKSKTVLLITSLVVLVLCIFQITQDFDFIIPYNIKESDQYHGLQLQKLRESNEIYIHIYKAFCDERGYKVGNNMFSKVIGVLVLFDHSYLKEKSDVKSLLYCKYPGNDRLFKLLGTSKITGKQRYFAENYLLCESPSGNCPEYVSIYASPLKITNFVPIEIQRTGDAFQKVGFCMSPLYNNNGTNACKLNRLIEWIEYHKAIGVNRFFFHLPPKWSLLYPSKNVTSMLDSYVADGILEYFESPVTKSTDQSTPYQQIRFSQQLVLNACLIKNALAYKYILLHDIDEAFLFRKDSPSAIPLFLDEFYNSSIAEYYTHYANFPTDCDKVETKKYQMKHTLIDDLYITRFMLGYVNTDVLGKSIFNPLSCQASNGHICYGVTKHKLVTRKTLDYKMVVLGHYRPHFTQHFRRMITMNCDLLKQQSKNRIVEMRNTNVALMQNKVVQAIASRLELLKDHYRII